MALPIPNHPQIHQCHCSMFSPSLMDFIPASDDFQSWFPVVVTWWAPPIAPAAAMCWRVSDSSSALPTVTDVATSRKTWCEPLRKIWYDAFIQLTYWKWWECARELQKRMAKQCRHVDTYCMIIPCLSHVYPMFIPCVDCFSFGDVFATCCPATSSSHHQNDQHLQRWEPRGETKMSNAAVPSGKRLNIAMDYGNSPSLMGFL